MKEYVSSVSLKGQITIPAEIRRMFDVKPKDKVVFQVEDDQVRLIPAKFTLETAYGSVKPLKRSEDFKEITHIAREEHVERVIRKMQES